MYYKKWNTSAYRNVDERGVLQASATKLKPRDEANARIPRRVQLERLVMAEKWLKFSSLSLTRQSWLGKYLNWRSTLWLKVKLPLSGRRSCSCLFIRRGAISIQLGCDAGTFGARPSRLFFVPAHAAGVAYKYI